MPDNRLKRKETLPLYLQLLALDGFTSAAMRRGSAYQDNVSEGVYTHNAISEDFYLNQAVAIVDTHLFDNLSMRATKLLLRIIADMKLNNIFWICEDMQAIRRGEVAELRRHEILFLTERKNLFIINPAKLRRGKVMASIMASVYHYVKDNNITSLTDLKPPPRARIDTGLAPDSYDIEKLA
jgi:hypothetical protein